MLSTVALRKLFLLRSGHCNNFFEFFKYLRLKSRYLEILHSKSIRLFYEQIKMIHAKNRNIRTVEINTEIF